MTTSHPASSQLARQLRWLIAIRLVVVTSVVVPHFLLQLASPAGPPTFDLLSLIAGTAYVASLFYIAMLALIPGRPKLQAYLQFGGDLALVTSLVYFFGGIASPFSMLYLVVIAVASVMLRRRSGLQIASAAYILYAGLLWSLARGWLPQMPGAIIDEADRSWRIAYNLAVHLFGFYAVALLTSYLAETVSRAEEALERKEASLADFEVLHRDVVQSIASGLVTADLAGRITSANRAALEILELGEDRLIGQPISSTGLFTAAEWEARAAEPEAGRRAEVELERGGERIPIGYTLTQLTDASGTRNGSIVVFQDLSDLRRMEGELRLKDRMAAVGELAAGLAHEVGNPLAAISGSVQLLSSAVAANPQQRRLFDIILKESQRLDRTIKGFLRFARPRERASTRFDVARLLAENTELLRNSQEATGRHRFQLSLQPQSFPLLGDPDQIAQIFWNLARNALRAMPDGGLLEIQGRVEGDSYRIRFHDTGRGMSEDERTKIFQPFKSTFDGGTGIGMAIVYRIVQEHGGRLGVESSPGSGTTIVVDLPARAVAAVPVAAEA
ncbi:MAG: ATP-binding protein [Thermoanaerobaculia bacterium]